MAIFGLVSDCTVVFSSTFGIFSPQQGFRFSQKVHCTLESSNRSYSSIEWQVYSDLNVFCFERAVLSQNLNPYPQFKFCHRKLCAHEFSGFDMIYQSIHFFQNIFHTNDDAFDGVASFFEVFAFMFSWKTKKIKSNWWPMLAVCPKRIRTFQFWICGCGKCLKHLFFREEAENTFKCTEKQTEQWQKCTVLIHGFDTLPRICYPSDRSFWTSTRHFSLLDSQRYILSKTFLSKKYHTLRKTFAPGTALTTKQCYLKCFAQCQTYS